MEKRETHTFDWYVSWYSHLEQYGGFLKKRKIELPYDSAIPLLVIYPDKTITKKDTCTPKCLLTDEWIKMCYIQWNTTHHKKEWNNAICGNMDAARHYHTK